MALSLSDYLVGVPNVQSKILANDLERSSWLIQNLQFDPMAFAGAGTGWVYAYNRNVGGSTAGVRALNSEFAKTQSTMSNHTVALKILGGAFDVDRATANVGYVVNQLEYQIAEKRMAVIEQLNYLFIKGDIAVNVNQFDGISKLTTGTAQELDVNGLDISDSTAIDSNYKSFTDAIDDLRALMLQKPDAYFVNAKAFSKVRSVARRASAFTTTLDKFGQSVDAIDGVPLINLGDCNNVPIIGTDGTSGETDIYAVKFGMADVHGILPNDANFALNVYMPDMKTSGAVKTGEVELITAIAVKSTKSIAKLTGLKVA